LTDTNGASDQDFLNLTVDIVSAYVEKNALSPADVPKLVRDVHAALSGLHAAAGPTEVAATPAVSIRKSITPDYLICLDDGKKFKSLKRHLSQLGMTPEQYRAKWNLPADYPMVAPNYSAIRSSIAIDRGLGRKAGETLKPKAQRRTKAAAAARSPV
jgi:predicted transcriptional regulator